MWTRCSIAPEEAEISSFSLKVFWEVKADQTYDISRNAKNRPPTLLAIKTFGGKGHLHLDNLGIKETVPDELIFIENQQLTRYHFQSVGKSPETNEEIPWHFWWFEFSVTGMVHFPLYTPLKIPSLPHDWREIEIILTSLRSNERAHRWMASAVFAEMVYRWLSQWGESKKQTLHHQTVKRIINKMHEHFSDNWTVQEMAHEVNLSERRFRQIFTQETGCSPKKFYDQLRLTMGKELLHSGIFNVSETAEHLGFSSPFHFSKAFKKYFGIAPSQS